MLTSDDGSSRADDVEDLREWLASLPAGPSVSDTLVLACGRHGDDRPTWMYVEADPAAGLARRRCLSCGFAVSMLDSSTRWTFPPMWSCRGCGHSLAELAAGLAVHDGDGVDWVVLGARCVECGRVEGLTDLVLHRQPLASVLAGL